MKKGDIEMAKKTKLEMPSQGDMQAVRRSVMGIDGTLNGGTKVQSRKGKKAYNRQRAKNQRHW